MICLLFRALRFASEPEINAHGSNAHSGAAHALVSDAGSAGSYVPPPVTSQPSSPVVSRSGPVNANSGMADRTVAVAVGVGVPVPIAASPSPSPSPSPYVSNSPGVRMITRRPVAALPPVDAATGTGSAGIAPTATATAGTGTITAATGTTTTDRPVPNPVRPVMGVPDLVSLPIAHPAAESESEV